MSFTKKVENSKLWQWMMKTPLGNLFNEILHFGIIGVFNTLLGIGLTMLFYNFLHWGYWTSTITEYTIGSIFSYVANKKLTFKVKGNTKKTAIRFAINIVICFALAYGAARPVVRLVLSDFSKKVVENVAIVVGNGIFIVLNFIGQKFFVFREKK